MEANKEANKETDMEANKETDIEANKETDMEVNKAANSNELQYDTRIITITAHTPDSDWLIAAGDTIKAGGLVAFPTETVYGLGGDALNKLAAGRIYRAKGRPSDNPLIVHICRMGDLQHITGAIPETARTLAERFWPGPLTMIFHKADCVPDETTGGLDTIAVRMPAHTVALKLIHASGGFIAAPSTNLSGRPSPTAARYVIEDLKGRIEMILDGGETEIGLESTILDMTGKIPVILRPGAVTREMLEEAVGPITVDQSILAAASDSHPRAPGMKYRHYAPRGKMTIIEGHEEEVVSYINSLLKKTGTTGLKTGVIATAATAGRYRADSIKNVGRREDEAAVARLLYRFLREFDDEKIEMIYAESFPSTGMGQAIMNRLLKAAGHQIIRLNENEEGQDHDSTGK